MNETTQLAKEQMFTAFLNDTEDQTSGRGKDSLEMYVEAAAAALTAIEHKDPTAVSCVKQVIQYLVSDSRLRPGELDEQKQLAADAIAQANMLQKKLMSVSQMSLAYNTQINGMKREINDLKTTQTKMEFDMQQLETQLAQREAQVKRFAEKERELGQEIISIRSERDQALKRQNATTAAQILQRKTYEDLLIVQGGATKKFNSLEERTKALQLAKDDMEIELQAETEKRIKLQEQYAQIQQVLTGSIKQFDDERKYLSTQMSKTNADKEQLLTQTATQQDTINKLQAANQGKQKALDKMQEQLDQANQAQQRLARESMAVKSKVASDATKKLKEVVDCKDAECQATSSIVRKDPQSYNDIFIDSDAEPSDFVAALEAEMSQTSDTDADAEKFEKFDKNDRFEQILHRIKKSFITRKKHQTIKHKYDKYKNKYVDFEKELQLQILNSEIQSTQTILTELQSIKEGSNGSKPFIVKEVGDLLGKMTNRLDKLNKHKQPPISSQTQDMAQRLAKQYQMDQAVLAQAQKVADAIPEAQYLSKVVKKDSSVSIIPTSGGPDASRPYPNQHKTMQTEEVKEPKNVVDDIVKRKKDKVDKQKNDDPDLALPKIAPMEKGETKSPKRDKKDSTARMSIIDKEDREVVAVKKENKLQQTDIIKVENEDTQTTAILLDDSVVQTDMTSLSRMNSPQKQPVEDEMVKTAESNLVQKGMQTDYVQPQVVEKIVERVIERVVEKVVDRVVEKDVIVETLGKDPSVVNEPVPIKKNSSRNIQRMNTISDLDSVRNRQDRQIEVSEVTDEDILKMRTVSMAELSNILKKKNKELLVDRAAQTEIELDKFGVSPLIRQSGQNIRSLLAKKDTPIHVIQQDVFGLKVSKMDNPSHAIYASPPRELPPDVMIQSPSKIRCNSQANIAPGRQLSTEELLEKVREIDQNVQNIFTTQFVDIPPETIIPKNTPNPDDMMPQMALGGDQIVMKVDQIPIIPSKLHDNSVENMTENVNVAEIEKPQLKDDHAQTDTPPAISMYMQTDPPHDFMDVQKLQLQQQQDNIDALSRELVRAKQLIKMLKYQRQVTEKKNKETLKADKQRKNSHADPIEFEIQSITEATKIPEQQTLQTDSKHASDGLITDTQRQGSNLQQKRTDSPRERLQPISRLRTDRPEVQLADISFSKGELEEENEEDSEASTFAQKRPRSTALSIPIEEQGLEDSDLKMGTHPKTQSVPRFIQSKQMRIRVSENAVVRESYYDENDIQNLRVGKKEQPKPKQYVKLVKSPVKSRTIQSPADRPKFKLQGNTTKSDFPTGAQVVDADGESINKITQKRTKRQIAQPLGKLKNTSQELDVPQPQIIQQSRIKDQYQRYVHKVQERLRLSIAKDEQPIMQIKFKKPGKKQRAREYTIENGKFISPFAEAIQAWRKRKAKEQQVMIEPEHLLESKTEAIEQLIVQKPKQMVQCQYLKLVDPSYPRMLSSVEIEILHQHKLFAKLEHHNLRVAVHGQTIAQLDGQFKQCTDQGPFSFVEVETQFVPVFNRLGFSMITAKTGIFAKATAGSTINGLAWALRTLRMFYYECDAKRGLIEGLQDFIKKRFPTQLLASRFLSSFMATLAFQLGTTDFQQEKTDLKLFALMTRCTDPALVQQMLGLRQAFGLDEENPATQSYEQQMQLDLAEQDFFKVLQLPVKYLKPLQNFFAVTRISKQEAVFYCVNLLNQQKLKQVAAFVTRFAQTSKKGRDLANVVLRLCPFLNESQITELMRQRGIEVEGDVSTQLVAQLASDVIGFRPLGDSIIAQAEVRFQMCEQTVQQLIQAGKIGGEEANILQMHREDCLLQLAKRNGLMAALKAGEYWAALVKWRE